MSDLLDEAITIVRSFPIERQDDVAHRLLACLDADRELTLTPEEDADLAEAEAEAARGHFATTGEMRAIWAKHDP